MTHQPYIHKPDDLMQVSWDWEADLAKEAQQVREHNEQWVGKWKYHCQSCGGWGGFKFTESHGLPGPGEQMFDLCEVLPEGYCHRCGMEGLDADGEQACFFCGWHYDDGLRSL